MSLEEIIEIYNPKAIYTCGSSTFLKGNDEDLVLYFETQEEVDNAKKLYHHEAGYDLHFGTGETLHLTTYTLPFMKKLYGEDMDMSLSILDHREEYVCLAKRYSVLRKENKHWYQIYTGLLILEKGENVLTKNEVLTIQKIKDNGISNEQYQWCIDRLIK